MTRRSRPNQASNANRPARLSELEVDFFLSGSVLWFHGKIEASQKYRMAWPVNRLRHGRSLSGEVSLVPGLPNSPSVLGFHPAASSCSATALPFSMADKCGDPHERDVGMGSARTRHHLGERIAVAEENLRCRPLSLAIHGDGIVRLRVEFARLNGNVPRHLGREAESTECSLSKAKQEAETSAMTVPRHG